MAESNREQVSVRTFKVPAIVTMAPAVKRITPAPPAKRAEASDIGLWEIARPFSDPIETTWMPIYRIVMIARATASAKGIFFRGLRTSPDATD